MFPLDIKFEPVSDETLEELDQELADVAEVADATGASEVNVSLDVRLVHKMVYELRQSRYELRKK